jgi:NAD(P)-dependent dehydrogenase (short-subunit alcohol dehydrogenase family)
MQDSVYSAVNIIERFRIDGKVALVTGGGQGIGRGYAHALGEAGARVAVVDISRPRAEEVAHELSGKGIDSLAVETDVTKRDQVERMAETIVEHWGSLTIGVNNAGMGKWADAESMPEEEWRQIIDLNLTGVFLCAQVEARAMASAGYGKIINTASMSAHIANTPQNQVAYNASKAGVLHLTRTLAAEWAPKGIRVNSISPGYTRTQLVEDLLATPIGRDMLPKWMSLVPMGRMAEVEDLQGAVVYLSAPVSDYMSGHDMVIDGGYTAW